MTLRVAVYCRVSTDREDQINSLDSQIRYFTEYINKHEGWELAEVYADEGITGTNTKKRDSFNRMITDAFQHKIDLIITKEVSRFARNTVDALYYTRKLRCENIGVIFINDHIDTRDSDGEFRLTIMASVAQEESRKTSERVKWGMKRKMERGFVFAGTIYGYDLCKGQLFVNEDEARVVRTIFSKFVHEGKGAYTIANELRADKVPVSAEKRMKRWSAVSVTRILKNEKYAGDLLQKKTFTPNYLDHRSVRNRGQEEQVFMKDHHQPIIDRATWEQAQQEWIRRSGMTVTKTRHSNAYWCSGKLFCGLCGSRFYIRSKKLKTNTYYAWRCKEAECRNRQINEKALAACIQFALQSAELLDASVLNELLQEIHAIQAKERKPEDDAGFQAAVAHIEGKKEKLIDLLLEGEITKEERNRMEQKYNQELLRWEKKRKETEEKEKKGIAEEDTILQIENKIKDILAQKEPTRELYGHLIERVILYPENLLKIYFKYEVDPILVGYEIKGRGGGYQTCCYLPEQ
jgi:site-specific DNA recombinase